MADTTTRLNLQDSPLGKTRTPWLRLAAWLVVAFAVFQWSLVVWGLMQFPAYALRTPGTSANVPNDNWTPAQTQAALRELGWPATTLAWFDLGRDLCVISVSSALGFILLRRKAGDWFSLYLALLFLSTGHTGTALAPATEALPVLSYFYHDILGALSWQLLFIGLFLFPDGRPVPGWTRWVIVAWLVFIIWSFTLAPSASLLPIAEMLAFVFVFSAIGSQVYRYWRVSSADQKQQTKWVVYALVFFALVALTVFQVTFRKPSDSSLGGDLLVALLGQMVASSAYLFIALAILLAILRYRLWDIDLVIRRTLVYALLTALLGLVYFGGVTLLQSLFVSMAGQQSPAAVVISTLLIAALVSPLRRRIQDFIDRRFYRQKYNAEQALAKFAAATRSETDLEALTGKLVGVAHETLQPKGIALWLRLPSDRKSRQEP